MAYDIVYDVERDGYSGWIGVWCGLALMGGCALFCAIRRYLRPASLRFLPCALVPFALCWILLWLALTFPGYIALRSALRQGQCEVVEGTVTDFQPLPSTGKGDESFAVEGVRFRYSDFQISSGFRHSSYFRGPIREGQRVRIHYRGNDIARLEIAREQSTATSNQAMQRTASKPATDLLRACHPRFDCVARFLGLAVADLVSR